MKVTINVSEHNIRHGDPHSGCDCIIQRAIKDAIPLADMVMVGIRDYGMRHVDDRIHHAELPVEVQAFIVRTLNPRIKALPAWLRWLVFRPFSFELDVPDEFVAKEPTRPLQSSLLALKPNPIELLG